MRGIRLRVELDPKAVASGHRYVIRLGDGVNSSLYTLASTQDKFATDHQWSVLLGNPTMDCTWRTSRGEGMYVDIDRQYPNLAFDFEPESYRNSGWLRAQYDVSNFRLYNPLFARACLDWPKNNGWGNSVPFSEGDQHQYAYNIYDYQEKINETDIQYTVKRLDDSDDYKEFLLRLSV